MLLLIKSKFKSKRFPEICVEIVNVREAQFAPVGRKVGAVSYTHLDVYKRQLTIQVNTINQ